MSPEAKAEAVLTSLKADSVLASLERDKRAESDLRPLAASLGSLVAILGRHVEEGSKTNRILANLLKRDPVVKADFHYTAPPINVEQPVNNITVPDIHVAPADVHFTAPNVHVAPAVVNVTPKLELPARKRRLVFDDAGNPIATVEEDA